MRLLFIADGRSPTATNWMSFFIEAGHEVHLISTFPFDSILRFRSQIVIPVAFSASLRRVARKENKRAPGGYKLRSKIRDWFGPLTVGTAARMVSDRMEAVAPDLVHAMRIPFEGMIGAAANSHFPFAVSVWGNDFTLHAAVSPWMKKLTRHTLQTANALHVDCLRDKRLAREWGFAGEKEIVVLPGGGGVKQDVFHLAEDSEKYLSANKDTPLERLPAKGSIIVNPRGFRTYVRNDVFFQSIPFILEKMPNTFFVCPSMENDSRAEGWIMRLGIEESVLLLPPLTAQQMGLLFRQAMITVSPTEHDGTPNTLLEAMACGCFPIAGDLESIREWIDNGVNGLLVNAADPSELAEAVLRVLGDPELRSSAAMRNESLIQEKARYADVMHEAEAFYSRIIGQ